MKYFIYILVSLIFLSCNDTVTLSKEEYEQLKGNTVKPEYPKILVIDGYKNNIYLGSDNHDYIKYGNSYGSNFEHYPDCKNCKKRNNIKLLSFPEITRMDTQYYVRAPRSIRPLHAGHEYLIQDTAKWLNEVVKPAILQNKIFIYNE